MKKCALYLVLVIHFLANANDLKKNVVWYLPSANTIINGIAVGPIFEPLDFEKADTVYTHVNGLALELIGMGVIMPLFPKSPNFPVNSSRADTLLFGKIKTNYTINGVIISPGGHLCASTINGLNISGIGTMTGLTNGFSVALFQSHHRINGFSISLGDEAIRHFGLHLAGWSEIYLLKGAQIGALNYAEETHGVQLGIYNESKKLKGFQLGLWNVNHKRKIPIINWNFRDE